MKRLLITAVAATVLGLLIFLIYLDHYAKSPLLLADATQTFSIKPKSGLTSVANQLVNQGVIESALPFVLLARSLNKASSLQAGDYTLEQGITPLALLTALSKGKRMQAKITFIEGKTFKDMRTKLTSHSAIHHTIAKASEAEIMALIGVKQNHLEGLFFPDTYYFDQGTDDIVILKRAYKTMLEKLETAWQHKAPDLPYQNRHEALIMASIIEKETGKASERPMIAGVFINRLRIGMRLQTDPTVIYGMGEQFKGNIRRKDLLTDTPYNTYTRDGLPPTPIAMPSLAAINAALHPAATNALYFVGKGDGSHAFSHSLSEHNRAVAKYQLKH